MLGLVSMGSQLVRCCCCFKPESPSNPLCAGVIPIDRLTDVQAPITVVLQQAGIRQIERIYNINVPGSAKRCATSQLVQYQQS